MVRQTFLLAALGFWAIGCNNADDAPDVADDVQDAQVEQDAGDTPVVEDDDAAGPALGDPAVSDEDDADPDRYATGANDGEADAGESTDGSDAVQELE